ncbi:hypothetical protein [Bulleidia extructa]|uniref:hypothetical protein n=1 Tax=Bulleidia extructa TaxID=118748 RepID=UPI003B5C16CD
MSLTNLSKRNDLSRLENKNEQDTVIKTIKKIKEMTEKDMSYFNDKSRETTQDKLRRILLREL